MNLYREQDAHRHVGVIHRARSANGITVAERWVVITLMVVGLVLLGQIVSNTSTPKQAICSRSVTPTGMVDIPCH